MMRCPTRRCLPLPHPSQALTYCTPSQQLAQVATAGLNFLFNIFNGFIITYPVMAQVCLSQSEGLCSRGRLNTPDYYRG